MNSKTGDTSSTIAVGVPQDITDSLMEPLSLCHGPDCLIHDPQVFSMRQVGIMLSGKIEDKEASKQQACQGHQSHRYPERLCTRQRFRGWIEIEAIEENRDAFTPGHITHWLHRLEC